MHAALAGPRPRSPGRLSEASGLHIVTNTGYYGAAQDKYLPAHAFEESAERLAERWTSEWRDGIEARAIRPGFIKTASIPGPLSAIDRKLIVAAALCHGRTGLRIHCHTGDGRAAMDILSVLEAQRVSPRPSSGCTRRTRRTAPSTCARRGRGLDRAGRSGRDSLDAHVSAVVDLARAGQLARVLLSPGRRLVPRGRVGGGRFRPYTYLFDGLLPALRRAGLSERDVRRLLVDNPRGCSGGR
jgi:phosphotriesterase-related protein